MSYFYTSTTGGTYANRRCGGEYVYCDGRCTHCEKAQVLFSTKTQTTNSTTTIHIVRSPK